jgi:hypothetical protein
MTTHLTKIWWDLNKDKLVEQLIPESEIYKREWVGLTEEEIVGATCECVDDGTFNMDCAIDFARAIESKLREKNNAR